MKKSIIARSVALAIVSSATFSAMADDKVIVVTANRTAQELNDTLADVKVIERADIERLQSQSFIDLLVNVSGIDTVQKGGQSQDASIFMRGANSNQVLILIDGVRVGSATLGVKSPSNIPVSQIERIEIVKGARAAQWGSDAIGGVIQIFTRRYESGEHRVAVTLGSNSTQELDIAVGLGNDKLSNTISYSHKESDGFDARIDDELDKDGYKNDSLAIRGDYHITSNGILDWVAQIDQGDSEFDTSFGGNKTDYNNHLWNIRYTQKSDSWNNQVMIANSRDRSVTYGNAVERKDASVFETRRQQFSFLTHTDISESLGFTGGVEWLKDNVEKSSTAYKQTERKTKSIHAGMNYIQDALLADFSIRYDDVESVSSETSFNIGIGYRISSSNLLSLNYAEGFKAPTFNDLYFPYGGNPNLQFETSDNLELVFKGFYDIGQLVVSVYDSDVDDLIQWTPDSEGVWSPSNVGNAEVSGIDASFNFAYGDFSHQLSASYVKAEDAATGKQLLRRAKQNFGYEVSHTLDSLNWFAQVEYVGKRPDNHFQTFMPINLASYTRVNLGMGYVFDNQWQVKLKVNDAFDKAPTSVSGYNPVEREFYLTISHQNLF